MDKIFHVFVSSTYTDLVDARRNISEAIAKAGYVAEGMEIFPASSQKQLDFIKSVIDRCDYYILIIGGRYGSRDADGISYTELEFRYATEKGIPILAFVRTNPDHLPVDQRETDPEALVALNNFRTRITSETLVDFWSEPQELAVKALAALSQARQSHPGIGWLRADHAASADLLNEINTLRKENQSIKKEISRYKSDPTPLLEGLASLDDSFDIRFTKKRSGYVVKRDEIISLTWKSIFTIVSPEYRTISNTTGISKSIERYIKNINGITAYNEEISINMSDQERILIHFEAKGLMTAAAYNLKNGGSAIFHKLTAAGEKLMIQLNAVYKAN